MPNYHTGLHRTVLETTSVTDVTPIPDSHTVHHQKLGLSRVTGVNKVRVSVRIRVRFSFSDYLHPMRSLMQSDAVISHTLFISIKQVDRKGGTLSELRTSLRETDNRKKTTKLHL